MSVWLEAVFLFYTRQSAHQISCGQMQMVTRRVPRWLENVFCVDVLTHARGGDILMLSPRWVHESICEKPVCHCRRAIFFNRRDDLTRLELRPMCLCLFQTRRLRRRACARAFLSSRGRLEPAATRLGLKFACFSPICNPQPGHRQHCTPASGWRLSPRQQRTLPIVSNCL